jgi:hypothetical protein
MEQAPERRIARGCGSRRLDVLLTTDKNMRYQQNLASRKIAVVVSRPAAMDCRIQ